VRITDQDYDRAQQMWKTCNCRTFKDYHNLYLVLYMLLLTDVVQAFRYMEMQHFLLDPALYLTLPSYSWDCCLKITGVELQLINYPEMHLFLRMRYAAVFLLSCIDLRGRTIPIKVAITTKKRKIRTYFYWMPTIFMDGVKRNICRWKISNF
jgi:hypothetical protein